MRTEKHKVYFYDRSNGGRTCFSFLIEDDPALVLLAEQEVEFQITRTDADIVNEKIAGLRKMRQHVLAEAEMKAANIEKEIQSMLAITHEPDAQP